MLKFLLTGVFLALLIGLFYAPMPDITEDMLPAERLELDRIQLEDENRTQPIAVNLENSF